MSRKKPVQGIILAGGEGKRLRPLSYYFQKCMIPIGNAQKPLLEYVLRLLRLHGITNLTVLVGYKHNQIVNYFNHGERFGVKIEYVVDDLGLKGTGGSLLNFYRKKKMTQEEDLVIYYGDIISNINLSMMVDEHQKRDVSATLAVSKGYQVPVGVAEVKGSKVICWKEKPVIKLTVGTGVVILNTSVLTDLEKLNEQYDSFDIMGHLIPHLLEQKKTVHAYITDEFWYDVGSTERYEKLENSTIEKLLKHLY